MRDYEFKVDPTTLQGVLVAPTAEKVAVNVASMIAQDRDGKIHDALVELGWTPPVDSRDIDDAINVVRQHTGAWQFMDGDWTQGSTAPETLANEVMRLRVLFRVNMLRHAPQATHADIDAILHPKLPDQI